MITSQEKLIGYMSRMDFNDVRVAWIARARSEAGRHQRVSESMIALGFEQVAANDGATMTDDGREIMWIEGTAWALTIDKHAQRVQAALAAEKAKRQTPQHDEQPGSATRCVEIISGQLCGGDLIISPVCPKCALGKHGVVATATCDVCGHKSAIVGGA